MKRLSLAIAGAAALGLMAVPLASANPTGGAEAICERVQGGNFSEETLYVCAGDPFFENFTRAQAGAEAICAAAGGDLFAIEKAFYRCLANGVGG